ncbi:MAG: D-glycero-beta-D-manno-heptose 1-phosphate adenylyltransferase [Oligoflexia bacterium]|nr:D-glycero-beta-D-manno-heptose 1-phosphate adenylyltransferase [Oligoflexia bacterium]
MKKRGKLPTSTRSKIKSRETLKRLLARRPRARVVLTNGCFDIIHKGHVRYLEKARALGDLLVVALNSDESVRRLKGPERPINRLEDRAEVMAALGCVDFVTWFGEDTPQATIRQLRPKLFVKGGDYRVADLPEAPDVLAGGGKIRIIPFVEGQSTTSILARARKR